MEHVEVVRATRRCPYCAEPIQLAAVVCRHCQRKVGPRSVWPHRLLQAFGILCLVVTLINIWPVVGRGILWLTNTPVGTEAVAAEPPPPPLHAEMRTFSQTVTARNPSQQRWSDVDLELFAPGGPYYHRLPHIVDPGQAFNVRMNQFRTEHGREFEAAQLPIWTLRVSATLPTGVRHATTLVNPVQ